MVEIETPVLRNDDDTLKDRLSDNAYNNILPARYLKKNEEGDIIEEQEELFERVAKNIAVAEAVFDEEIDEKKAPEFNYENVANNDKVNEWADKFQDVMEHLKFVPNTPTLINAGTEMQQLSACFVDSPEDDMKDIGDTETEASLIFQSGGGVGYDFGNLRPYGDPVGSTGGIASGPITFMQRYDQNCETVAQGGVRRGAQMGTMPVTHPDIIHFIHAKNRDVSLAHTLRLNDPDDPKYTDFGKAIEEARELIDDEGRVPEHLRNAVEGNLSNFNISVTIPDEFMDAVKNDEDYTLINPRTNEPHIATEETKQMYSWFDFGDEVTVGETLTLPAQEIWTRIIEGAWNNGEPGVMFIDEVNREHSYDTEKNPEYEMTTSNPCAEQNLMEYEACNLGHINLSTIVNENMTPWPKFNTDGRSVETFLDQAIDWAEFNHRIDVGTRFLDNVVTMSDFPIDDIEETVRKNRKIGLGIMGLAQLYIELGVEYGSEEGNLIARQLMKHINHESKRVSHELAEERGVFENWEDSKYSQPYIHNEWMNKHVDSDWQEISDRGKTVGYPIRNHNTTTIAPTGTTSMIGNTSGGCEPIFNVAYYKNVTDDIQGDEMLVEFDSLFLETLRVNDIDVEEAKREAEELMENNEFDGPESLECVPDDIASLFVTTGDLDSQEHASVMCELQKGVDSSISKTLNAPFDATVEDAKETFEYVYDNGGKSVTFYRDGSRTKQVQTTRKDNQDTEDDNDDEMPSPDGGDDLVRQAPKVASGVRYEIETGYGDMFVNIVEDEHGPVELIANVGKSGGTVQSMTEAIGRLVSKSLQNGVSPQEVINQLENIHSPNKGWDEGEGISSVPDGIAVALKRYINTEMNHPTTVSENYEEKVEKVDEQNQENSGEECLECGSMNVQVAEGCATCQDCGYSKCG
jgi:ribonucleoside-diphosphate reductase alpha chain